MNNIAAELIEGLMEFKNCSQRPYLKYFDKLTARDMAVFFAMKRILDENPKLEQVGLAEIGKHIAVSKSAVTQNVNRLEDRGLIERVILKSDRRATYVRFTDYGNTVFNEEKKNIELFMNMVVKRMGKENSEAFVNLLKEFSTCSRAVAAEINERERNINE